MASEATGPYGAIGRALDYETIFDEALAGTEGCALPWRREAPYSNRFWKKYITAQLLEHDAQDWSGIAWNKLVPFKVAAPLPAVRLLPEIRRGYAEAFVWPAAFGFLWNNWIETELDADGLAGILNTIRNGRIGLEGGGRQGAKALYHGTLDGIRAALWGKVNQGIRSEPITVVSIIRAAADPDTDAAITQALTELLDRIEAAWGDRPRVPAGDRHADSGHTVYVADGLRLVWLPRAFLAQYRTHSGGCLHHNMLAASLQVEMLATAAQMLSGERVRRGSLPGAYQAAVERVLDRIDFFLSGSGYSAPFLTAQLERKPVAHARSEIAP